MVREVAVLICQIRLWNHIASRADDFSKRRILPGRARDQRHIIGTCIMIVAVKPVRIGKMRIHTSDLRSPCIHHICKSTDASADIPVSYTHLDCVLFILPCPIPSIAANNAPAPLRMSDALFCSSHTFFVTSFMVAQDVYKRQMHMCARAY